MAFWYACRYQILKCYTLGEMKKTALVQYRKYMKTLNYSNREDSIIQEK